MHAQLDRGAVKLLTRTGLDWTHKYPAIAKAVAALDQRQAYLDGELCGVGPDDTTSFNIVQLASGGYVASWTAPATGDVEPYRADIPVGIGQPASFGQKLLGARGDSSVGVGRDSVRVGAIPPPSLWGQFARWS